MKPAGQMTSTLTRELEQFVRDEVKRGAFASSSEYVRDLIRERFSGSATVPPTAHEEHGIRRRVYGQT